MNAPHLSPRIFQVHTDDLALVVDVLRETGACIDHDSSVRDQNHAKLYPVEVDGGNRSARVDPHDKGFRRAHALRSSALYSTSFQALEPLTKPVDGIGPRTLPSSRSKLYFRPLA